MVIKLKNQEDIDLNSTINISVDIQKIPKNIIKEGRESAYESDQNPDETIRSYCNDSMSNGINGKHDGEINLSTKPNVILNTLDSKTLNNMNNIMCNENIKLSNIPKIEQNGNDSNHVKVNGLINQLDIEKESNKPELVNIETNKSNSNINPPVEDSFESIKLNTIKSHNSLGSKDDKQTSDINKNKDENLHKEKNENNVDDVKLEPNMLQKITDLSNELNDSEGSSLSK